MLEDSGVPGNQNDANYGAGNYRPHKNSHHHDNWTDPNPKWTNTKNKKKKGEKEAPKEREEKVSAYHQLVKKQQLTVCTY